MASTGANPSFLASRRDDVLDSRAPQTGSRPSCRIVSIMKRTACCPSARPRCASSVSTEMSQSVSVRPARVAEGGGRAVHEDGRNRRDVPGVRHLVTKTGRQVIERIVAPKKSDLEIGSSRSLEGCLSRRQAWARGSSLVRAGAGWRARRPMPARRTARGRGPHAPRCRSAQGPASSP